MRVLAVWSIKGGVGKTTTATALAALAAGEGQRTLLWDLDPQGAASHWFRVRPENADGPRKLVRKGTPLTQLVRGSDVPNLDLLPADLSHRALEAELTRRNHPRRRLALKLAPLVALYEWVFLDCAPSVTLVSEAVLAAVDGVLVPVVPSSLSLRTLEQVRQLQAQRKAQKVPLLPFLAMVDRRRRLHRDTADALTVTGEFLASVVPLASAVEKAAELRTPVTLAAPGGAAAAAYRALWREVQVRLASQPPRFSFMLPPA